MTWVNSGGVVTGGGISSSPFAAASDVAQLQSHTSGYINVQEAPYSAKGDGTTDDTAAIQAALNAVAAAGGGLVLIPDGVYIVGSLTFGNKVTIRGASRGRTTLKAKSGTLPYLLRPSPMDGTSGYFHIRDLAINGNVAGTTFTEAVVSFQAAYAGSSIENITLYDYTGAPGIWFGPGTGGDGIAAVFARNIWVQRGLTGADAIGIYVSSDYPATLYEAIVTNLVLEDVIVENTGAQPAVKVYAKTQNHVRALRFANLWMGGFSVNGLVLDGIDDSVFEMIYGEGPANATAVVNIPTPTNGDTSPYKGLQFRGIVSRNSTTPAIVDTPRSYSPGVLNLVRYETDGLWATGSKTTYDSATGTLTTPNFSSLGAADGDGFKISSSFLAAHINSGALHALWFGSNSASPTTSNYTLMFNPGGSGQSYLNAANQVDLRIGNSAKASVTAAGFIIGAGTAISLSLRGTGTLGTGAIGAGTTATQNITVTGAAVGAEVIVGGPSTLEAGLILYAYVSATNTVTLRVANVTAGSITPAGAQTVSVRVFNP